MTAASADRDDPARPASPRPGWEIIDAARASGFTGELEFALDPVAHVYLERGEVYLAECDGDPPVGARLVAAGVLEVDDLDAGTVTVAGAPHLGRLFERVPAADRAAVLAALEMLSGETVAWVAARTCRTVVSRPYVHHPSGVNRWYAAVPPARPQLPAPLPAPVAGERPLRGWRPTRPAASPSGGLRIEWLERDPADPPTRSEIPRREPRPTEPRPPSTPRPAPPTSRPSPQREPIEVGADHGLVPDRFELVWPSGEVGVASPPPAPSPPLPDSGEQPAEREPRGVGALVSDVDDDRVDPGTRPSPSGPSTSTAAPSPASTVPTSPPASTAPATSAASVTEQMRLAVRRTVSAIEEGMVRGQPIEVVVPVPDDLVDPFDRWSGIVRPDDLSDQMARPTRRVPDDDDDLDPFAGWSAAPLDEPRGVTSHWPDDPFETDWLTPGDVQDPAAQVGSGLPDESAWDADGGATFGAAAASPDVHRESHGAVRRGTLANRPPHGVFASAADDPERKTALQRLIDGLRGR